MGDTEFMKLTANIAKATLPWDKFFDAFMPPLNEQRRVPLATFSRVIPKRSKKENISPTQVVQRNLVRSFVSFPLGYSFISVAHSS